MAESETFADRGERDRLIVAAHRSGRSMTDIAAEVGLSTERVRQVVRRADGGARPRRRGGGAGGGERVRLRIGNMAKAVLVTGQAYQDPKDALNEFVSNAADDYAEAGLTGQRIRILLRRRGAAPRSPSTTAGGEWTRTGCGPWPATCSSPRRPATTAPSARRRSACSPSSSSAEAARSCRVRSAMRRPGRSGSVAATRRPSCSASGVGRGRRAARPCSSPSSIPKRPEC